MDAASGQVPVTSSAWSLLASLLEPNWLILCSYLALNVFLTYTVLKLARSSEPVGPPVYEDGHSPVEKEHQAPVATFFINISAWAFRDDASNAKRLFALLAIGSLASTWYYMISFLHHSYIAFIQRCQLSGCPLPPLAPNLDLAHPSSILPALHLRVLRISQWLASISLFKEAWMEVIKDPLSWWWSSEICLITVGPWALFLYYEAKRLQIKHVWAFMALGQLVAISFSFNLFSLALAYSHRMPYVASPPFRVGSSAERPLFGDRTEKLVTSVRVHRVNLPRKSSWSAFVPDNVGLAVLAAAGLSSVLQHPNSFTKVMVMHGFPMLIVLYPRSDAQHSGLDQDTSVTPKGLYLLLGGVSVYLRISSTSDCFRLVQQGSVHTSHLETAKSLARALFPTTFLQHPAQSSISSDHVSVAVGVVAFIAIESGLWLWRIAKADPDALCRRLRTAQRGTGHAVYLGISGRRALEGQALLAATLLVLSPFLGASATLSYYLALRCSWTEKYEAHAELGHFQDVEHERRYTILRRETTREIVETEDGERELVLRQTKVAHYLPRRYAMTFDRRI